MFLTTDVRETPSVRNFASPSQLLTFIFAKGEKMNERLTERIH